MESGYKLNPWWKNLGEMNHSETCITSPPSLGRSVHSRDPSKVFQMDIDIDETLPILILELPAIGSISRISLVVTAAFTLSQ